MWQWRAVLPRRPRGSIPLDCRPEPGKRLPQVFILDVRQCRCDARRLGRIGLRRGWLLTAPEWGLSQCNPADGLPAEEPVHPFEDHGGEMLNFQGCRTLDPQDQRGWFRRFVACRARPVDFKRLAMGGDLRSDNVGPAKNDLGRGETLRLEDIAQSRREQVRKRPGKTARGLAHDQFSMRMILSENRFPSFGIMQVPLYAIAAVMTVAARLSPRKKARTPEPAELLAWYNRHARVLPWRARRGERTDPYRVWLSEIMLQQTTVKAVAPYYASFLSRWPTVDALAAASIDDILRAWAGLGYYARARNLHACARVVVERHGGRFPHDVDSLRELPGIGDYTAAAIAAIAFDRPAMPVDGNIERVVSRLFAVEDQLPAAKPAIKQLAASLLPLGRAGDFAQALMDLGATICSPKRPACFLCPWTDSCLANTRGDQETFPRKAPKREGRLRRGAAFVVLRGDARVLLRQRPDKGLLASMMEVPGSDWTHDFDESRARRLAPRLRAKVQWQRLHGIVRHVFTHFPLELVVFAGQVPRATAAPKGARWVKLDALRDEALPNLMRKVLAHALDRR